MSKTVAAIALAAALLGSQAATAQASDVRVDVRVKVNVPHQAREVCNDYTCWTDTGATPRSRKTHESVERYERTTEERY